MRLPVDETHLLNPTDVNGINKISGEFYHLVYHSVYGIRSSSLRLTNTYGPRQLIKHNRQGFIGWFIRQAVRGEEIQLFGDGQQKRDFDYVDDVVDALLRAGRDGSADGEVFNLGGEAPVALIDLAKMLVEIAGRAAPIASCPSPPTARRSTSATSTRTRPRSGPPWAGSPEVPLRDGLARTIDYYREHAGHYL
jgi:UDP-glucose 4-epimerase